MRKNDEPIVVERTFSRSIATVWDAITKVDLMRQWYFDNIPDFKAVVGFETHFSITNGGREFLHKWHVTEVEPLTKLKYNWTFEGYPGKSFTVWELFETGSSTRLRLTAQALESFPQDIPEFKRESGVAGWEYFLGMRLKEYLSGA